MPKINSLSFRLIGLLLFLSILIIYIYSTATTVTGYADSDELITIGHLVGVAHPSGYPLVILLVKVFTSLPLPLSIAHKANLLAAFAHAGTVLFVYLSGILLLSLYDKEKSSSPSSRNILASLFGAVTLAFCGLYWLYASVIEVHSINNFLAITTFYAALQWYVNIRANKFSWSWYTITLLLIGLGLGTVQTYVLIIPALALLWFLGIQHLDRFRIQEISSAIVIPFISFALLAVIVWFLNMRELPFTWSFPPSFSGLWNHILRTEYSGLIPEAEREIESAYIAKKTVGEYISGAIYYLQNLISHFSFLPIALSAPFAIYSLFKRQNPLVWVVILWIAIAGIWFGAYMGEYGVGMTDINYRTTSGVTHRQYLIGYVGWGLFCTLGFYSFLTYLQDKTNSVLKLGVLATIATVIWQMYTNHSMGIQRHPQIINIHTRNILTHAQPNSAIICFSDISCFSLMYLRYVENIRPDVEVFIKNENYQQHYLASNPQYQGFSYQDNPYFTADLIAWSVMHRPTYITEPNGFYINYIGLDSNPFYLVPENYMYRVTTQLPNEKPQSNYEFTSYILQRDWDAKNIYQSGLQDYFAHIHSVNGVIYSKMGYKDLARQNFEYSIELNPEFAEPRQYIDDVEEYQGDDNYQPGTVSPTAEEWYQQALQDISTAQEQKDPDAMETAYRKLHQATFLAPTNPDFRYKLAELYQQNGYFREANLEYQNILRHNPDFQAAQQKLDQLSKARYFQEHFN